MLDWRSCDISRLVRIDDIHLFVCLCGEGGGRRGDGWRKMERGWLRTWCSPLQANCPPSVGYFTSLSSFEFRIASVDCVSYMRDVHFQWFTGLFFRILSCNISLVLSLMIKVLIGRVISLSRLSLTFRLLYCQNRSVHQ